MFSVYDYVRKHAAESKAVVVKENVTDQLWSNIGDLSDKSSTTRVEAMVSLIGLLRKNVLDENLEKYTNTLCHSVETNLRRSNDESTLACVLVSLLAIQNAFHVEDKLRGLLSTLLLVANDNTKPEYLRANAAQSIGIAGYFGADREEEINEYIDAMADIWSSTESTSETSALFTAALESWTILLHKAEEDTAKEAIENYQPMLCEFLSATNIGIRIAAGEAIATLYQLAKEQNDVFEFDNQTYAEELIKKVSRDVLNHNTKREKRTQKLTFHEIDFYYNTVPEVVVKFNKTETLEITDCMGRLLYDNLSLVLMDHVNAHLSNNTVIRDVFDLGEVAETKAVVETTEEKMERQLNTAKAIKLQTIYRKRQREMKSY